jgi:hypothetical protein
MAISKNGIRLTSLTEWETQAKPKSSNHWSNGRSAKEVARAWLGDGGEVLPVEVAAVLVGHDAFGPVQTWDAEPEAKLRFDDFAGETRNSDLAVRAHDAHGDFLIAVEAKADEPFGETVADALASAVDRYLANNRSNGVARIEQLAMAILGPRQTSDPALKKIRYQLLTASAGALCESERRGHSRALLLIHEFITTKTSDKNHLRNTSDLRAFVTRLSHGAVTAVPTGSIQGPFTVPGGPLISTAVALYVGKVTRCIRSSAA